MGGNPNNINSACEIPFTGFIATLGSENGSMEIWDTSSFPTISSVSLVELGTSDTYLYTKGFYTMDQTTVSTTDPGFTYGSINIYDVLTQAYTAEDYNDPDNIAPYTGVPNIPDVINVNQYDDFFCTSWFDAGFSSFKLFCF